MKKILAMVLAMMLVLSMSAAFAESEYNLVTKEEKRDLDIKKVYTKAGGDEYPHEVLAFTAKPADTNPTKQNITIDNLTVGETNDKLSINLPGFTAPGVYVFTISETEGATQGVTYTKETVEISVLVEYDYAAEDYNLKVSKIGVTSTDSAKNDTFTNKYDMGNLTVKKTVSGNMASTEQLFDIQVVLTSDQIVLSDIAYTGGSDKSCTGTVEMDEWTKPEGATNWTATIDVKLKATEQLTFSEIPAGVTYAVTESADHAAADANGANPATGYEITYKGTDNADTGAGSITSKDADMVTINNEKSADVNTGIALDNAPYMILMALVVVAGAALIVKRASANC